MLALLLALLAVACTQAAGAGEKREFPPFVYASSASLQAYRVAADKPELLEALPCYCGCVEPAKHRSLKDCFIKPAGGWEEHASACDICGKEALDAAAWSKQGKSPGEIRTLIDAKYAEYGRPTDTPLP